MPETMTLLGSTKRKIIKDKNGDALFSSTKRFTKFHKIHNKIIQRQLQMSMIKKYLKKDIYLQKKDKKLLMI